MVRACDDHSSATYLHYLDAKHVGYDNIACMLNMHKLLIILNQLRIANPHLIKIISNSYTLLALVVSFCNNHLIFI